MRAEKPPARRPAQRALFKSNTPMWQGFATLNDMTEKDVRAGDIFKEAEQLMRSEQPIK